MWSNMLIYVYVAGSNQGGNSLTLKGWPLTVSCLDVLALFLNHSFSDLFLAILWPVLNKLETYIIFKFSLHFLLDPAFSCILCPVDCINVCIHWILLNLVLFCLSCRSLWKDITLNGGNILWFHSSVKTPWCGCSCLYTFPGL